MTPEPQALPKPVAQPRKKQTAGQQNNVTFAPSSNPTVAFNDAINLINNTSPPSQFGLGAPDMHVGLQPQPRRAADYQPPTSFVENMDRPLPMRASPNVWTSKDKKEGDVLGDLWSI